MTTQAIFGAITLQDMRANASLTQLVMPLIARACAHSGGRWTPEAVADGLIDGSLKLWGTMQPPKDLRAVAITRMAPYESGVPVMELLLLGGPDHRGMFRFLPALKDLARRSGAERMVIVGKKGWADDLPEEWVQVATIYECSLERAAQD
ncbi:MAG: hypothetical protein EBR82_35440 [Caulobacteraceae bacterium]|nr:hypothetical protein [Caulobacteraceae bacterium]